jgi:hypothetical protein
MGKESNESDFSALMSEGIAETILEKAAPFIKPATKRFSDFINDGNTLMVRAVKGKVNVFWIKQDAIESFSLKSGAEPSGVYDMEDFIQQVISGKFNNLT